MRRRSPWLAAFLAAFIALATTGSALADQAIMRQPVGDAICGVGESSTADWLVPIYRERPVAWDPDRPQYPDGVTLTLSLVSVAPASYSKAEVTVLDPTVVLPDDWTSQPDGSLSTDTFLFQTTVTYLGGLPTEPVNDVSEVTFEMSAGDSVERPVVWVGYKVGGPDCPPLATPSPVPTTMGTAAPAEAAAPAARPTAPPTDTVVTRPTSPANGLPFVALVGLVGLTGTSIVAARWLRRR
jgi:hypothetical protein